MQKKMFGHRIKKRSDSERVPGEPFSFMDSAFGKEKDNPPNYEGKEHVKYKNPGFSSHKIKYPQDEPHMKSNVTKQEMHRMEDNYHMDVPDQTPHSLEAKIKRAKMKMDAPDQEEPKPLMGNMVHNVGAEGVEDTSGEEEMGPNYAQGSMGKEHRKKMIVAITKRKMNKSKKR